MGTHTAVSLHRLHLVYDYDYDKHFWLLDLKLSATRRVPAASKRTPSSRYSPRSAVACGSGWQHGSSGRGGLADATIQIQIQYQYQIGVRRILPAYEL